MTELRQGISVIIPAYNSALSLPELLERLSSVLKGLGTPSEVIVVNDGSRDNTWDVLQGLAAQYQSLRAMNLMRNYGQHNALLCGIRAAQYATARWDDDSASYRAGASSTTHDQPSKCGGGGDRLRSVIQTRPCLVVGAAMIRAEEDTALRPPNGLGISGGALIDR